MGRLRLSTVCHRSAASPRSPARLDRLLEFLVVPIKGMIPDLEVLVSVSSRGVTAEEAGRERTICRTGTTRADKGFRLG